MLVKYEFNGRKMIFKQYRKDFAKIFGMSDAANYVVCAVETVVVDIAATEVYAKYASIFELICNGKYHTMLKDVDEPDRAAAVEEMVADHIEDSTERIEYINKRIDMYTNLIIKFPSEKSNAIALEVLKKKLLVEV